MFLSMSKSSTTKIALFEPNQAQLKSALQDRELSPALVEFLTNLLRTKRWTRKINIPSGHSDVAAVLVFTTALMESGFEIYSELHVFFAGKVMVEKWQVVGEKEQISLLPKQVFDAIDVNKVRVEDGQVFVEISAPVIGGHSGTLIKTFDFSAADLGVRVVPHPLLDDNSGPLP